MANGGVSPWFRSNLRGQALRTPEAGYQSKWDVGGGNLAFDPYRSPVYNMLQQQGRMNRGVAGRQLGMLRGGGGGERRGDAARAARNMEISRRREREEAMASRENARRRAEREARGREDFRAQQMATSLLSGPGRAHGMRSPGEARNLTNMIQAIGVPRAHQGLMQSGRLLAAQGGGGMSLPGKMQASRMAGGAPSPYGAMAGSPTSARPGSHVSRGTMVPSSFGYEKGSVPGTVPETGPYEIHENEIVISADQADPALLSALKQDKLSKLRTGQMDGKGTGPGSPTMPNPHHKGPKTGVTAHDMVLDEFQGGTYSTAMEAPYRMGGPAPAPMPEMQDPNMAPANPFAPPGMFDGAVGAPPQEGPMYPGMDTWDWIKNFYGLDLPEGAEEPEYMGSAGEQGEWLGKGIKEAWGETGKPVGEFFNRLAGAGQEAAEEEQTGVPEVDISASGEVDATTATDKIPSQGSIEQALEKVQDWREGGEGRGLSVSLGPGDMSEEDLERDRERTAEDIMRRGEDMAQHLDTQKADRMRDYALRETWLDPQIRDGMLKEADRISKAIERQKTERMAVSQARAKRSQDLSLAERELEAQESRFNLAQEAGKQEQGRKHAQRIREMATSAFLEAQAEGDDIGPAIQVMTQAIIAEVKASGGNISPEDAWNDALRSFGMDPSQFPFGGRK